MPEVESLSGKVTAGMAGMKSWIHEGTLGTRAASLVIRSVDADLAGTRVLDLVALCRRALSHVVDPQTRSGRDGTLVAGLANSHQPRAEESRRTGRLIPGIQRTLLWIHKLVLATHPATFWIRELCPSTRGARLLNRKLAPNAH